MDQDLSKSVKLATPTIVVATDDTPIVSSIVDTAGFDALMFAIGTGTLADAAATFTVLVEESDASNMSGANAVADGDLVGTEAAASFTQADDGITRKIGYTGSKRYVRLTITPSGNATSAPICIMPILGHAKKAPQ